MIVVYYTQTYFLDAALETLQSLKKIATVHLLIELAPESKKSTIIDIASLDGLNIIESFKTVLDEMSYLRFLPYLNGIASVNFVVHSTKQALSPVVLYKCRKVMKFIHNISPDVIHFDTVSGRSLGLIPLAKKYSIHITIHDPVAHSGEKSWKKKIINLLFYRKAINFFFYSQFAKQQFALHNPTIKQKLSLLRFQPFSFVRQFSLHKSSDGHYILFFGRMSPYKGIDILLAAIPMVLKNFPGTKFILAGCQDNYSLNSETYYAYKDSITVISAYLSIQELSELIMHSKFIVCPYRDATQSGVLMTAFAFAKPVLATRVGAFPEYITDGVNGLLANANAKDFAHAICMTLSGDRYMQFAKHLNSGFSATDDQKNQNSLKNAYDLSLDTN